MGGVWARLKFAVTAFFTILFRGRLPAALEQTTAAGAPVAVDEAPDRAVQMLAVLQRDGRLVDFLMEDLTSYTDVQVGAAVRDVHGGCRRALDRYVTFEPIVGDREGDTTTVGDPIDTSAIRLVGNVTGHPPFRGTLLHRGWRVARIELPPLGARASRRIVAQAEVEIA